MTFTSMHRPLSAYTEALSETRLGITALREYGDRAVPWLLVLRAEKRTRSRQFPAVVYDNDMTAEVAKAPISLPPD